MPDLFNWQHAYRGHVTSGDASGFLATLVHRNTGEREEGVEFVAEDVKPEDIDLVVLEAPFVFYTGTRKGDGRPVQLTRFTRRTINGESGWLTGDQDWEEEDHGD